MRVYLPPSLRSFDKNYKILSSWIDHVPFAYDLVEALEPKLLVELGTHEGLSFFTFCQSVVDHHLDTVCYAVDTWEGEHHAGYYGEDVYRRVVDYCRENYAGCSYLIRSLFADACNHFERDSIDLLHIDGLHTYDAVKEDYQTWVSKVRPGGLLLFHDIAVRRDDLGVWKFWKEIGELYPEDVFQFNHGYGLGVLRKPGGDNVSTSVLIDVMFSGSQQEKETLRAFYVMAAKYNTLKYRPPAVISANQKKV